MKWLVLPLLALATSVQSQDLRIATGGHYPPYIIEPMTPDARGLDKDLMDEVCARGGYTCTWIDLPMSDIFQALARGDVDVVTGGFGYSVERDALVDFTCPYVTSGDNTGEFVGVNANTDLITARIGVLDQSLYQAAMVQAGRDVFPFATEAEALNALVAGKIDVVFGSHNMVAQAESRDGFMVLGQYPTSSGGTVLAVSEDAPSLRRALDALLADISADGTLSAMHMEWFGEDPGDVVARCLDLDGLT